MENSRQQQFQIKAVFMETGNFFQIFTIELHLKHIPARKCKETKKEESAEELSFESARSQLLVPQGQYLIFGWLVL